MNKGVTRAHGEFVVFMNAGDRFYSSDALYRLASVAAGADFIYGDHVACYGRSAKRLVRAQEPDALWRGMICSHQAMLGRRELLQRCPFDTIQIGADFDLLLTCYVAGAKFLRVDSVIAEVEAGGVSDRERVRVIRSWWRSVRNVRRSWRLDFHYLRLVLDAILLTLAKRILPIAIVRKLQLAK
jgi:hypothetical protein